MRHLTRPIVLFAIAAAGYFAAARVGYALAIGGGTVTLWPPAGVTLALLLLNSRRSWPAIAGGAIAGSVASDLLSAYSPALAAFAAAANVIESIVAARAVMWLAGHPRAWTTRVRGVLAFTVGAALASNAVTSFAGATMLSTGFDQPFLLSWFVWWAGDGLGMLIVTPAILTWADAVRAWRMPSRRRFIEAAVVAACLAAASLIALGPKPSGTIQPGAYVVFPFLFWAAVRFGPAGAATASFALAGLSTWLAFAGYGPLALAGRAQWVATLQVYLFLAVASVSSLIFAAVVEERRAAALELVQAEERFRRAQKLEAVGKLAGGIAHDFNNLLTVIQGNCDLLSDVLTPGSEAHGDLTQIRGASQRAAALTRQLLAFSRRQMLAPQLLQVQDVIASLEPMLQRFLGGQITIEIPPSGARPILADLSQLEQIVLNLSVNARDAMAEGGTLRFEVRDARLDDEAGADLELPAGDYVRLDVADTGHGVDADTLEHLFEPFFTTKPEGQGTGLGLATVHGIVKQSRGSIDVSSEPGRGTTFTLFFPAASA